MRKNLDKDVAFIPSCQVFKLKVNGLETDSLLKRVNEAGISWFEAAFEIHTDVLLQFELKNETCFRLARLDTEVHTEFKISAWLMSRSWTSATASPSRTSSQRRRRRRVCGGSSCQRGPWRAQCPAQEPPRWTG